MTHLWEKIAFLFWEGKKNVSVVLERLKMRANTSISESTLEIYEP